MKKPTATTAPSSGTMITNCTFAVTGAQFNEHTQVAVTAPANAAKANAEAITAIANAIQQLGSANMGTGISIGTDKTDA